MQAKWAQSQVKFCGQIIGSGKRFADREKIKVVDEMGNPKTKTELRRILGFLTFFSQRNVASEQSFSKLYTPEKKVYSAQYVAFCGYF